MNVLIVLQEMLRQEIRSWETVRREIRRGAAAAVPLCVGENLGYALAILSLSSAGPAERSDALEQIGSGITAATSSQRMGVVWVGELTQDLPDTEAVDVMLDLAARVSPSALVVLIELMLERNPTQSARQRARKVALAAAAVAQPADVPELAEWFRRLDPTPDEVDVFVEAVSVFLRAGVVGAVGVGQALHDLRKDDSLSQ